jgi:hypothetical protein
MKMMMQKKSHTFFTAMILACLLATAASAQEPYFTPARYRQASLSLVSDIPIIHLYGSPAEMGDQHGQLLASQIRTLITEYINKWLEAPGQLPTKQLILQLSRAMELAMPQAFREEMHAISRAANVSYDDVLLTNTVFDIKKVFQCSTMVGYGTATSNGQLLLARNLDFAPLDVAHNYGVVFVYHPEEGHEFVAVGYPGLVGVLSGMNDAGLAEAIMEVRGYGSSPKATPYAMIFRRVLQECGTTTEAISLLRRVSHSTSNNLMLADASGNACVAELTPTIVGLRRPDHNLLFATNHFRSPRLWQDTDCSRYRTMQSFALSHYGRLDVAAMQHVLLQVAMADKTLQSMVFIPETRELSIAMGMVPAAAGRFVHLGPSHWRFK